MSGRAGASVLALGALAVLLGAPGCHRRGEPTRSGTDQRAPDPSLRRDLALTPAQAEYLAKLAANADAHPDDAQARKASGLAHMRFALSGVLSLRERAELDLEAALRLDRDDRELARALGRFYNMRAVERDGSKAAAQIEAYRAYLGEVAVGEMRSEQFVAYAFSQLGHILELRNRGRLLAAYGVVKQLEDQLRERTTRAPDDIELLAVAGNFSFFFAGNIPSGKKQRVRDAVNYFTQLRARWSQLREGARDPEQCPNTYENFMFELAEGHVTLGELDRARPIYEELTQLREPITRPKQQIAFVAAERLRNLDYYDGKLELMPPWPSDLGNCVVCHAYTSEVPLTTLYSREPLTLDDMPRVESKPIPSTARVPDEVRAILGEHCSRCHGDDGAAESFANFDSDAAALLHSAAIGRRVAAGEMPPDQPLPPGIGEVLTRWAAGEAPAP